MAPELAAKSTVDVRNIAPRDRHPLIFSTFRTLRTGETMELVNDHDPRPLYYQFQSDAPGSFTWAYLEAGPQTWRVAITRVAADPGESGGSCCGGGCSGGRA
jgi:uncharacterized protein (DUF2249 family)